MEEIECGISSKNLLYNTVVDESYEKKRGANYVFHLAY
jgi:hypothetical protein